MIRLHIQNWESSILNHSLYDVNGLVVASIAENLGLGGFDYWVYSRENKVYDYASGHTDTLEAAQFLTEMLAQKAGWKFKGRAK